MSRIAIARDLVKQIQAALISMDYTHADEIRRVYSMGDALYTAISYNLVERVTDDGIDALTELLAELREPHGELSPDNVPAGTILEIDDNNAPSNTRIRVEVMPMRLSDHSVMVKFPDGRQRSVNLFWNGLNAVRIA